MPAKNPRLQVSMSEELLARYKAISESLNVPASKIAADVLAESVEPLEKIAAMYAKARAEVHGNALSLADGLKSVILDARQKVADVQLDLEDAIAEAKKKNNAKAKPKA